MTTLTIDPQRLKTVRTARKLGRSKLAKLIGLTERQLTRLETASAGASVPEATMNRLAAALAIPALALTGDLPLIAEDLQPVQSLQPIEPAGHSSGCSCCG
jgi:transcriptional regulator with XRE-family HTH domain